jgi:alkanesulfonate monooxygenase SsuD/methylene tetrahydromethanopterin reductase-like flavin-dependent oxidoreductase (luciferase family)
VDPTDAILRRAVKVSLFYLPSVGSRANVEAGLAGLRGELYDRMLAQLSEQARLADEVGYDSISFTEHHFHVEGFELSNNPVLLDLFVAMQTTRIRVGQLGIVLPANNPIRVAEDIAMLDHMSGGRANAGFARGYQRRWVDVLAQQTHGIHGALPHQHDEIDAANRAAFEECFRIIKAAWTSDLLAYKGRYWRVPPGETPWDLEATRAYGAGVEDGIVRRVGVVPKPLQRPHPPIFQPFASSERTIRWCAREGVTAILPPLHPTLEAELFRVYAEESGRPLGDGVGVLRDVVVADTDDEALALWADSGRFCGAAWFSPFGFSQGLVDPATGEAPEDLLGPGLALVGTVDTVTRQLERLLARLPTRWLFAWTYNSLIPHDRLMRSIELFASSVLPRVADVDTGAGA